MIFKANGMYKKQYLTEAEKALLVTLSYFKDNTDLLYLSEDFSNLMMDSTFNSTVTDLLNKVNDNLEATYYLVAI